MRSDWEPIDLPRLLLFGCGLGLFLAAAAFSEPGFIPVLDHANLLFHEAGHPIVGLFSTRLEPYGGTFGQLAFPVVIAISSWRKRRAIGVAAAAIWFFQNGFNIARYMADARALELPLVGGGDHDWNTILNRWGILHYDVTIASWIRILCRMGILLTCGWVAWWAWKTRNSSRKSEAVPLAMIDG